MSDTAEEILNPIEALAKLRDELAVKRKEVTRTFDILTGVDNDLHATAEWERVEVAAEDHRKAEAAAEEALQKLKAAALLFHKDNPDVKKPLIGVEIRLFHIPQYDEKKVISWCVLNASAFLENRLRRSAFEKAAATLNLPADLYTETTEARVYVSRDLEGGQDDAATPVSPN